MKKLCFLFVSVAIVMFTMTTCEKPSIESVELQTLTETEASNSKYISNKEKDKDKTKVALCHSDETGAYIATGLSPSAVQGHLAHGDDYIYSPREEWAIIKTNTGNGVVHHFDVNVNNFDGTNFSGTGIYYYNTAQPWEPPNFVQTGLRVWGTVDNTNGDMDIFLEWDITNVFGSPRTVTFNFGGTTCMCSGINEIHEYGGPQQFRLDQPVETCITY